jgi:hypothetical protein
VKSAERSDEAILTVYNKPPWFFNPEFFSLQVFSVELLSVEVVF